MIVQYVYCAVNANGEVQWICGSSTKRKYFQTKHDRLVSNVEWHNKYYADDPWHIVKFKLVPVEEYK